MAYTWISAIKNDTNEVHFPVPLWNIDSLDLTQDFEYIRLGGYRKSSSEAGSSTDFLLARTFLNNLIAQKGLDDSIYDGVTDGGLDKVIYGKSGGTGARVIFKRNAPSGTVYAFDPDYYKYLSFTNYVHFDPVIATGVSHGSNAYSYIFTYGFLMDEENERIFAAFIFGNCSWANEDHAPSYYDNAQAYIYVIHPVSYDLNYWSTFHDSIPVPEPEEDPYDFDPSEPSGAVVGDHDETSDVIDVPSIPAFNLTFTKMISVWAPTLTQVQDLADYIWGQYDKTDPTKLMSKVFQNPLDSILSLHYLPFTPQTSTAIEVTLAGFATGVNMLPAAEQFHDVDCGTLEFKEYWGNYLDYTGTKIVLCLPYVGQVDLDPDEVMGKTISVKYRIDVITGAFVCFVYINGDKILGQYSGNCAMQVPLSAADYSRLNAAVLGVAATAATGFGGAAASGFASGSAMGLGKAMGASLASNLQNAKVRVQHSGGLTGAPGFMGRQKPYAIIHRVRQSVPSRYNSFRGYPSNVTRRLGDLSGFTSVREIRLEGLPYTDAELEELDAILKGGIFI